MSEKLSFEQWVQSRLTAHGFPVGLIDGKLGPVSIAALKKFQKRESLDITGKADAATVEALRKPSSTVAGGLKRSPIADDAPGPVNTAFPRQSGVPSFYGAVGTRQTSIELPFEMRLAWDLRRKVRKMTLHEKGAPSAIRVFNRIASIYDEAQRAELGINIFSGSLNVRRMRGGSAYSMHSWGIAIDFDHQRNQLKWGRDRARLAQPDAVPFWEAWEAEGWLSLGRARNFDWMHVQAARL